MTLIPQNIYQGPTIMKWNTWKILYFIIAIPLSLQIGVAINASPHRQAIVIFMMVLLAIKHHTQINKLPDIIDSWLASLKKSSPKIKKS